MSLFQNIITKKYITVSDAKIKAAYNLYSKYFFNPDIQENIRSSKEEQFQEGFLRELFVKVLGYTLNPQPNYNLTTEKKNEKDSKKTDGAIIKDGKVVGVIELKDHKTTDLKLVETQAFGYKNSHSNARYVVISNFEKLRFYIDNYIDPIEFNLFTLNPDDFALLWLCLAWENIAKDLPLQIKAESVGKENDITKELYKDYSNFKRDLFADLTANNPHYDQLTLFKKSQKLLDRLLFILFAEDSGLLPENSIAEIIAQWEKLKEMDAYTPLYNRLKMYFGYMNTGHKGKHHDIFAYNGGLFKADEVLDSVTIADEVLRKHSKKLSEYYFASEVDVNILGHIFENSLTEIEEITNAISAHKVIPETSKRKKDGIFYTPRYITKYIVDNTLGKLCTDKKAELGLDESDYSTDKNRHKATKEKLIERLKTYRTWLLSLTICDPACGSGAFLNAALDYLMGEHKLIDEMTAKITKTVKGSYKLVISDIENSILENNLYGVDINEESVEIAKLALWLRTAKPQRKLNSLNDNIKCGNSLISDPAVAGDKAFDWHTEFPHVFAKGGFDVVIGNPPYGALITKKQQKYYLETYKTPFYKIDTYAVFIERGLNILKENRALGFIVPYTFLTIQQHKKLREFLLSYDIHTIVNLPTKVFESADLDTAILLVFKSNPNDDIYIGEIENQSIKTEKSIKLSDVLHTADYVMNINNSSADIHLLNKIKSVSDNLSLYCEVSQGYIPYRRSDLIKHYGEAQGNKIVDERLWHSDKLIDHEWKQEIQGSDISRYRYKESYQYVKYGKHVASYVDPKFFKSPRIIIMEITRGGRYKISAVYTDKEYYNTPSIINIISRNEEEVLKAILAIVNSRLMTWYHLKVNPKANAETSIPKILVNDVRNLPIPKSFKQHTAGLTDFSEKMLSMNTELQAKRHSFAKCLTNNLDGIKITGALERFDDGDFKQLLAELKKQKITIPLKEQGEWDELFTESKTACNALSTQIAATDHQIDQMIYDLYNLIPDEIAIIESV